MRVIAGEYRGRTLAAPKKTAFRPTSDRVKETLFNILAHSWGLRDADFCDLFAGSGSIGLEALSRGAAYATFVENSRTSMAVLRKNLEALAPEQRYRVVATSAESFLKTTTQTFSLMFADPPYAYEEYGALLETVRARGLLNPPGVFVIEHTGTFQVPERFRGCLVDRRDLGATRLSFFQLSAEATS